MGSLRLDRRTVLKGLLGGAVSSIALPTLECMLNANGTAYANGTALPKRLGVFFWGNGVRLAQWNPSATGANWAPSDALRPLASVKNYVSVVSGMEIKTGTPRGHHAGTVGILSGAPLVEQAHAPDSFASTFSRPSIDVVASRVIGTSTQRPLLNLGVSRRVTGEEGTTLRYLSHNGPDNVNPSLYDPRSVFTSLFGGMPSASAGSNTPDPTLALRSSVLDAVAQDATSLRSRVGANDRLRLEQHLDSVRQLERQIQALPAASATCTRPEIPGTFTTASGGREQLAEISQAMNGLVKAALACDLTRVFTIQFSGSVGATVFWQVGTTREEHALTHDEGGSQPTVQKCVAFTMQQFGDLLQKLRDTPEGAGNLLDNCAILASTDLSEGKAHTVTDYPILVAGKAGGALKYPGVHYRSTTRENTSTVLLSVLQAVGLPVTEFGTAGGRVTSGCSAIEA